MSGIVEVFEQENVSTWGGLEPPTFGFMPNALTIWAIHAISWRHHALYDHYPGTLVCC